MQKIKPLLIISIPEVILLVIVYLGYWFKILHLPWGNMSLTVALLTLATIYMAGGCLIFSNTDPRILFKKLNPPPYSIMKMIFGLIAGLGMAVWIIAIWAKILHMPIEKFYIIIFYTFAIIATLFCLIAGFKFPRIWFCYIRVLISFGLTILPSLLLLILILLNRS